MRAIMLARGLLRAPVLWSAEGLGRGDYSA
jgi:hypothetical protein